MFFICSHAVQIGCPFMSPPARPTPRSAATLGSAGGMHRHCLLAPQLRTYNALSNPSSGDRGKPFSPVATQAAQNASRSYSRRSRTVESVLVCIFKGGSGELRVILTNRSSHSGEVWLPGGHVEDEDRDVIDAALREAKEEIGIDGVSVVCMLDPFIISEDDILPLEEHLGRVSLPKRDLFTPVLTKDEVHEFWGYPSDLSGGQINDGYQSVEHLEGKAHYFDYEIENKKFLIWGLAARILIRAAFVAYQTQPSFLVDPWP